MRLYSQSTEGKYLSTKNSLPRNAAFSKWGRNKNFHRQTKAKGVNHHQDFCIGITNESYLSLNKSFLISNKTYESKEHNSIHIHTHNFLIQKFVKQFFPSINDKR